MRSKVVWIAVLAAVVTLTAAGCTTSLTGQASGAAVPSGSPAPGSAITVATMHVTLPQGMRYRETSTNGSLDGCLSSGSVPCEARILDLRAASAGPGFNAPSASRPYGWYTGSDVPHCITPIVAPGTGAQATGSTVLERGFAPIGPKKAEYARWQVTCADAAQDNQVRVWWLPTSKILVTEYASTPALDARIDQLLASATFD